jgi:hypothetical protein
VSGERCSWCGAQLEEGDGWRAAEPAGERVAGFCRLEHAVPWAIKGAHWEPGTLSEPAGVTDSLVNCSHCGAELPDRFVVLVRHRGEHRIPDGFCSAGHMADWAKAGGRWQ